MKFVLVIHQVLDSCGFHLCAFSRVPKYFGRVDCTFYGKRSTSFQRKANRFVYKWIHLTYFCVQFLHTLVFLRAKNIKFLIGFRIICNRPRISLQANSHCLETTLKPNEMGTLQFYIPGYQNDPSYPKQKEFLKSTEGNLK